MPLKNEITQTKESEIDYFREICRWLINTHIEQINFLRSLLSSEETEEERNEVLEQIKEAELLLGSTLCLLKMRNALEESALPEERKSFWMSVLNRKTWGSLLDLKEMLSLEDELKTEIELYCRKTEIEAPTGQGRGSISEGRRKDFEGDSDSHQIPTSNSSNALGDSNPKSSLLPSASCPLLSERTEVEINSKEKKENIPLITEIVLLFICIAIVIAFPFCFILLNNLVLEWRNPSQNQQNLLQMQQENLKKY